MIDDDVTYGHVVLGINKQVHGKTPFTVDVVDPEHDTIVRLATTAGGPGMGGVTIEHDGPVPVAVVRLPLYGEHGRIELVDRDI